MELIDRYVAEVSRRLALVRGRVNVEQEVRAALDQRLAERAAQLGRPADEAMAVEVLREFGPPAAAATRHNPYPYLVGPRVFPVFLLVIRIVLAVLVTVLVVLTAINVARALPVSGLELARALGEGLAGIASAVLGAFGGVVLAFAVVERFVPAEELETSDEGEWDPRSLLRQPTPDTVKPSEAIVAVVFTALAIVIFTAASQVIALYYLQDGSWVSIPLLSDAFFRWLPLLVISWLAEIALQVTLLRTGRWTLITRLASIAIKILQLVILLLLITGPSILALTPESLTEAGFASGETAESLVSGAQTGIRIALGLGILGTVVDIVRTLVAAVRSPGRR